MSQLVETLLHSVIEGDETVAAVASRAGLGHETVRQLLRNPTKRPRYGPGFFIVAALADAQQIQLDDLVAKKSR